jgi:predicted XRE-type DNA-binding protein
MPSHAGRSRKVRESVVPKNVLAKEIARILDAEGLTQTQAASRVKDAPSQISLMVSGKLRGFSAERLIRTLTRLGRDVDIVMRMAKSGRAGKVRLTVK